MVYLYGNGNAGNHGCEALSRTIADVLDTKVVEFAVNATDPKVLEYGLKQTNLEKSSGEYSLIESLIYRIAYKLKFHNVYNRIRYGDLIGRVKKKDLCLSIGGDNYCYEDISWLKSLNKALSKRGKTVLFGNSIEPDLLNRADVIEDLKKYSLIIARESLTYEALCAHGLNSNTMLYPDTAFVLEKEKCEMPKGFQENNMVGVNISPLIMAACKDQRAVFMSYKVMVQYILDHTDMGVALIPHVVWERNDDRVPLQQLFDSFKESKRVILVEDQNCCRLKYIISQCRFFVAARTHASIAAYSTGVPTLVIGYSIKSRGIAKDIFGSWEHYVIPAQSLLGGDELTNAFVWLLENELEIKNHLQEVMPEYCERVWKLKDEINSFI